MSDVTTSTPGAEAATGTNVVLEVEHLSKDFPVRGGMWGRTKGAVHAVDDVSLTITRGETLGVVGESGSGKTTLGRMIVRAVEPTAGTVRIRGEGGTLTDITAADPAELKRARRNFHMIFQDPYSSLNPRMTVEEIVAEPLANNLGLRGAELRRRVIETLELVGLGERHLSRYPHAFSGGQRQRVGIARSLACRPNLIVCDEAVSALDVSIQAQILNLLKDLQRELDLSYLFITHDLGVVEHLAHRVAVMYVGQVVELSPTDDLFSTPLHPYSEALLSASPVPDEERTRPTIVLKGEVANPASPPSGCYFHPRCPYAQPVCSTDEPRLREITPGRWAACHFAGELGLTGPVVPAQTSPAPHVATPARATSA
ncbi:ATP-binding cassette domain-containing protein [Cellulomonas sp. Sa3CUA2]|uniref:ATP-binding cassette domain-containing protein n=1 Tax=Cellulomonas avistercoris TaxID=2762242 RepID=A0ABR8QFE3_9CELL|nr:oligopeptide/dipeptide ABC transporter ATP-binding protein [Cellulomonas avistercoris]MBD7919146.1 ATP-binding cassette domain-containing protein [Cellulomonas avistercoris]